MISLDKAILDIIPNSMRNSIDSRISHDTRIKIIQFSGSDVFITKNRIKESIEEY